MNKLNSISIEDKHNIDVIDDNINQFHDQGDDELNNEERIM